MKSSDSRSKDQFNEQSGDYKEGSFHHLSIPEFSNVNLYNQKKPFLKKNSINTPENFDHAKTTPEGKKHFEYGTPITDSKNQWYQQKMKGSFHEDRLSRQEEDHGQNMHLLSAYEMNQLENKYKASHPGNERQVISQFNVQDAKTHQSLMDNRMIGRLKKKKSVRESKRRKRKRSKSRTNWSKQRIKRELEKFEEELQDEEKEKSIINKVHDLRQNPKKTEKARKLESRRSKRSSVKAINNSYGMGVVGRQKKSRATSRNSNKGRKGHVRRISSQLEESEKMGNYQPKMVRSQVRGVYTSRNNQIDYSHQYFNRPMDYQDKPGMTSRNVDYQEQKRRHQMRQLRSSRDINQPIMKRTRQSYEQNYVPRDVHRIEDWERMQLINRHRMNERMNYESNKESNRMNFDYRNINANAHMQLPFE